MPNRFKEIDYSFRPSTYFPSSPSPEVRLSRIKGLVRRNEARQQLAQLPEGPDSEVELEQSISSEEVYARARIHPALLGGEYLPDMDADEAEIVRISLESVTADQISIRVRRTAGSLVYSVVDEYETEYHPPLTNSDKPLSLEQLVDLVHGIPDPNPEEQEGLIVCSWRWNLGAVTSQEDKYRLRHFVALQSAFYPSLHDHFELYAEEWFRLNVYTDKSA